MQDPTPEQNAEVASRDAYAKSLRDQEVAGHTGPSDRNVNTRSALSDELLANIEPEAKQYYDATHDLENALQLSIAISTKRASGPVAFAPDQEVQRRSVKNGRRKKKAKKPKKKVSVERKYTF